MKESIYRTDIKIADGKTLRFFALTSECDAKADMRELIHSETKLHHGMIRIGEIVKSSRRPLANAFKIKSADGWGWVAPL